MADSTKILGVVVFAGALLLWAVFGMLLLVRQGNLSDLWAAFRGQPWILQGLELLILLPWAADLCVWNTSWELWVRALLVLGLAWASL